MFEVTIYYHMQDTVRLVTDDPAVLLYSLNMAGVYRVEMDSVRGS
jgi:hypothetical protein